MTDHDMEDAAGNEGKHAFRARLGRYFFRYGIGLVAGSFLALYGLWALITGQTFLPGQAGGSELIQGRPGFMLALAYLSGGLFLVLRLFVEPRIGDEHRRDKLDYLHNFLLIVLIAGLVYVLLNVGEVK